jgi:hypothetical protein
MSPASSGLKDEEVASKVLLATCFMLLSCWAYSSNLNIEATCSSGMSVDFEHTTRHYILEDRTLHNHHCENLRSTYWTEVMFPVTLQWNVIVHITSQIVQYHFNTRIMLIKYVFVREITERKLFASRMAYVLVLKKSVVYNLISSYNQLLLVTAVACSVLCENLVTVMVCWESW